MNDLFFFLRLKHVNLSGKKTYEFTNNLPEFFRQNPPVAGKPSLGTHALCGRGLDVASWSIHDSLV